MKQRIIEVRCMDCQSEEIRLNVFIDSDFTEQVTTQLECGACGVKAFVDNTPIGLVRKGLKLKE